MKIIFIGPQGSGKGTQAVALSKKLSIPHISTGDLFRNSTGKLKEELNSYMNEGKLVPDELTVKILKERISQPDCKKGFILDGFPRNLKQAKLLEQITEIDIIIEIILTDDEAVKRISRRVSCEKCRTGYNELTEPKPEQSGICDKCGGKLIKRADDLEDAVKKRLSIYHKETEPILESYSKIIKINGQQSIEKIEKDIENSLGIKN